MGNGRSVIFVSNHEDTADLYAFALEQAGYAPHCSPDIHAALTVLGSSAPLAVIVHLLPRHDPAAIGALLRQGRSATVLIGLLSMQLPVETLTHVLEVFDDVVLIPCSPDALVARVAKLEQAKRRQQSA